MTKFAPNLISVGCPACRAAAGQPCTNDQPLGAGGLHDERVKHARAVSQYVFKRPMRYRPKSTQIPKRDRDDVDMIED